MLYTYVAIVQRVIDADTVIVDVSLGFDLWHRNQRIRLAHINAPEMSTPAGVQAREYLLTLLNPLPATVTLLTIKDRTDNYGRYLGVLTTGTGVNVNQTLLDHGYAVPYPS